VAFRCGIDGRGEPIAVDASNVPDAGYHTYEVGLFDDLRGWITFWVAPGANPDNVEGIWVDRAWLVAEK
jgi:hypothetical protein